MRDPYEVLGVARGAEEDEIKRSYRRLAKELHPDVNDNDPKVAERFKEVSAAYGLLGRHLFAPRRARRRPEPPGRRSDLQDHGRFS